MHKYARALHKLSPAPKSLQFAARCNGHLTGVVERLAAECRQSKVRRGFSMQSFRCNNLHAATAAKWMTRATVACAVLAALSPCASAEGRGDKSEAQQIEQLRVMVLQLQDRVDGLERRLNERRTVNFVAGPASLASELTHVNTAPHGPDATPNEAPEVAANVPPPAVQPAKPQIAPQPPQPQTSAPASPLASVLPANLPGG